MFDNDAQKRMFGESSSFPSCLFCRWKNKGSKTCKAFPNGIPEEILSGQNPHTSPYEGDNGIVFSPKERSS